MFCSRFPNSSRGQKFYQNQQWCWVFICALVFLLLIPQNSFSQKKVVLQLRYDHQFQSAGFYAAQWNGYYKDAGLDVEIRPGMNPDGTIVDASEKLATRNADFGIAASDALISRANGVPMVLLASIFQESGLEILARPEVKMLSPRDLERLRVQGGIFHRDDNELIAMLEAEGINSKNISLGSLPSPRTFQHYVDRFFNGEVDATLTTSLSVLWIARERGVAFTRMRPSSYNIDFYGDSLFTLQDVIDKDPEMVEKFVDATLKGWNYALEHPEEMSRKIATTLPRVLKVNNAVAYNEFLASRVKELAVYPIVELGHINENRWRLMNDALKAAKLVDKDLDLDKFVYLPKQDRAESLQFRYKVAFATLVGLSLLFVAFAVRSRSIRRKERFVALQTIRQSESRLRAIVDTDPECIKVVSSNFELMEMNAAGLAMLEVESVEEAQQCPLIDFIVPEHREPFIKFHEQVINGEVGKLEFELIGKRGTRRYMETHATPLVEDSGSTAFLAVSRDISEKKHANDKLRQKDEELQQMQKMEAIGRLAGGIAHDFNNLLTAINGYSDLSLRKLEPGNPVRHNLEEIRKAGDRAADLTRQLLAFSRKQIMKPKFFNLNQTVADINKMLARLIGEDIEIVTKLDSELGQVRADPGHIEQMLVNLVVNARDAMSNGGKLTIETANVSLDNAYAKRHFPVISGQYILLAITDTGIGMDKETLDNIFEPFFTTKAVGSGTGLGLSTVHGIVKQSGGDIWVYSEINKGTTFKIYLPRVFGEVENLDLLDLDTEQPQGRGTILLVEDNEQVANIVYASLVGNGYEVLKASHGDEAISICQLYDGQIDLLLTDVVMPRMTGPEVAEHIRNIFPEISVLYISGYTENSVVHQRVLDEGILFLEKPFTPDALLRKVREILSEKQNKD